MRFLPTLPITNKHTHTGGVGFWLVVVARIRTYPIPIPFWESIPEPIPELTTERIPELNPESISESE